MQVAEVSRPEYQGGTYCTDIEERQWFAAFTFPNHEKRVSRQCVDRLIESFLPLYRVTHRWRNRHTAILERPLFPGYVFVRIASRNRVRVLELPGVVSIVSSSRGQLLPVPEDYLTKLRNGIMMNKVEPHGNIEVGEEVRIVRGAFAGAEGILERRKNELRVVLRLEMLARSVSLEVDASEIEGIHQDA
jgi:transcription antitermination factor NusG